MRERGASYEVRGARPDLYALTVSQPFATLIATGEKWVENRTWSTALRGEILIHAGAGTQYMTAAAMRAARLPIGGIVARATLVDCLRLAYLREWVAAGDAPELWRRVVAHKHAEGPWCLVLDNIRPVQPAIICNGAQKFWRPPATVIYELEARARAAAQKHAAGRAPR